MFSPNRWPQTVHTFLQFAFFPKNYILNIFLHQHVQLYIFFYRNKSMYTIFTTRIKKNKLLLKVIKSVWEKKKSLAMCCLQEKYLKHDAEGLKVKGFSPTLLVGM